MRFVDNVGRGVAGVVTWIILWIVVLLPWQLLSAYYHTSQPQLARAIADVGGALMSFVVAGFCIYLMRMAVALTLATRETRRAYARVGGAMLGQGTLSTASPRGLTAIAVALTTPTDLDFLVEIAIGALVLLALVAHAHSQGFPLVIA